ncbi:VPLPA-CTERM-specific exosortase XrtD [Sneathiella limimaris]|uniref:VPLPA-CTERM-specific exosortase XrtD n=1 Tax=Sneathiella limimaris TaxID=1964213 RepID=UPI00146B5211|nr:VPLPA-CTERM-specific exosortase XrtD [Sneathiella limimaris]
MTDTTGQQQPDWSKYLLPVSLILVLVFYFPDAHLLWDAWMNSEEFSHGPLMLAVSLYLLWKRRELLKRPDNKGRFIGVAITAFSIVVYSLAIKAGIENVRHLSTFAIIFGLFLTFGGFAYARFVFPSLILLPFVVPPPSFLNSNLSYGLQLFSSDVSVFWLRSIGITVFQDGNIIDLGKMKLEVAEACSGLRYLYPMIGLGALSGMLFDIKLWKRILFLILAAAVSIFMNSVRIFLTGAFVEFTDMGVSEGFFHLFEGWVFFLISFALTLAVCWLTLTKKEKATIGNGVLKIEPGSETIYQTRSQTPVYAVIALCVCLVPLSFALRSIDPVIPERDSFASFPLLIDGMIAEEDQLPRIEQEILQMSDYYLGHYRAEGLPPITLFAGYYEQQSAGRTPHSPRVCIPSGGWKITDLTTISLNNNGISVPVNRVMIGKGEQKLLVYYWFQQRGKYIANEYMAKFNLLLGGLKSNRTDGALIRLSMPVGTEMSEVVADQRLADFAGELFEILPKFIPNE